MIDNDASNSIENSDIDNENRPADDEISKSQRKREADEIRELGARLTELGASELASIDLPDDVISAIKEYSRIKAHGARKRQLGYLAKRLRHVDIEPINAALEKIRQLARSNTISLHKIEHWRDRLLGDIDGEHPKEALTAFLAEFKGADRQQFRHLQAQALKERQNKRSPAAARQLFKAIRDETSADPDSEY
ncbi:MAG: ribosome biogenesis factor YjgA [Granulosicoccus sp.]